MKILAISGLMLAAAASAVAAAPAKDETAERVSYTADGAKPSPSASADWVELASPTPVRHTREYVTVDGRYGQLRIDAHKGAPLVKSVKIVYANGKQRTVSVGRRLVGKRPTALIDLGSAPVDHVVINTDPNSNATYTVHAARATGVATR